MYQELLSRRKMITSPQIQVFTIDGCEIAAQIPDDSVGCSGSRCTNCNSAVAYCDHHCPYCHKQFIGPFGFPQLPEWRAMTAQEQVDLVAKVDQSPGKGQLHIIYTSIR